MATWSPSQLLNESPYRRSFNVCALRVRAALRAALRNSAVPLVFTALIAERCRAPRPRFCAAVYAWRDKLACEAAECPSRCSAAEVALDRVLDGRPLCALRPFCVSRLACSRVCSEVLPFFGGASFTPARRAFDSPIAMACCGERAPCFPSRMWCISSRTNSPACTLGDFPSSAS